VLETLFDDLDTEDEYRGKEIVTGGEWFNYQNSASTTELSLVSDGNGGSAQQMDYTLGNATITTDGYNGNGYAGLGFALLPGEAEELGDKDELDLSACNGISYRYKGAAHRVRVEQNNITDNNVHGVQVDASDDWTPITVPKNEFEQEAWGDMVEVALNWAYAAQISWQVQAVPGSGTLAVDDIKCVGAELNLPIPERSSSSESSELSSSSQESSSSVEYNSSSSEESSSSAVSSSSVASSSSQESSSSVAQSSSSEYNEDSSSSSEEIYGPTPILNAPELAQENPYKVYNLQGNLVRGGYGAANLKGLQGGVYIVRTTRGSQTTVVR
jgi:hypothetical protein